MSSWAQPVERVSIHRLFPAARQRHKHTVFAQAEATFCSDSSSRIENKRPCPDPLASWQWTHVCHRQRQKLWFSGRHLLGTDAGAAGNLWLFSPPPCRGSWTLITPRYKSRVAGPRARSPGGPKGRRACVVSTYDPTLVFTINEVLTCWGTPLGYCVPAGH